MKTKFTKVIAGIGAGVMFFTFAGCGIIKGETGINGLDGKDGVGIENISINEEGELIVVLTDGTTRNLGDVVGEDGTKGEKGDKGDMGEQGKQGEPGIQGEQGIQGTQGEQGIQGTQGLPGRGIKEVEIIDGELWITYTDDLDNPVNLGKIVPEEENQGTVGLEYYPLPDGTYGVAAGTAKYLEEIVIPSTYEGKQVTQIIENAFDGAENLKSIAIPDTITVIENSAFNNCIKLEAIVFPESVEYIGAYAFYGCEALKEITIPSKVKVIYGYSFAECKSLTIVHVPETVTVINPYAFYGSSGVVDLGKSNWKVSGPSNTEPDRTTNDTHHSLTITISSTTTYLAGGKYYFRIENNSGNWYLKAYASTWIRQ